MTRADWEPAREPPAERVWLEILRPIATELAVSAPELSEQAVSYMRSKHPELYPDRDSFEGTRASTLGSIRAIAQMITEGSDPSEAVLPSETVTDARALARRGVPIASIMRNYRLGQELVWRWLLSRISARAGSTEELAAAVELGSAWLFGYIDTVATLGEQFYAGERERWLRTTAASRAETIQAILTGEEHSASQASGRLRYELDRHHLGLIAWIEPDSESTDDPHAALEIALAQIATGVSAEGSLVHPIGSLATAAWVSRSSRFDESALDAAALDPTNAPGVRIGMGEPGRALEGFIRSHAEAGHARRVATLSRRAAGTVTRYQRVALAAMATVDDDQARTFVQRALGELAADDDVSRRLAATLAAYLEENASRRRAARRLGIHENTIAYRIRQAEEVLARPVESHSLELRVALALLPAVRGTTPD